MRKYEFTGETRVIGEVILHQIKAVIGFGEVTPGELGGWIEKEANLSQQNNAWVCGNAKVYGNAQVYGDAEVRGNAEVYGNNHIIWIGNIGSRNDTVTFMRSNELKILVTTGCFYGDLEAFVKEVESTHGDNKHAKAYFSAIELAKLCIDLAE